VGAFSGPDLSENGLVLALDAANPKNYNLTAVEVLVVAGGGGGGSFNGGGGGAGGLIYSSSHSITPGSEITATVGGGGVGDGRPGNGASGASGAVGTNGGNSVFDSLIAIGGGVGASYSVRPSGVSGGSGGGSWGSLNFASGTASQGNAGGGGYPIGNNYTETAGGGGGAGSNGVDGGTSSNQPGAGGLGLLYNIIGNAQFYAAGGGAGANRFGGSALGGSGIGGNGGTTSSLAGVAGVSNSGSGGGGAAYNSTPGSSADGGAGGSGIVIVRYPGPQKAIGGTITSNNGYTIHTFTTSGTFTFTSLVATNNSAVLGLSDFSGRNNFATAVSGPTYSTANFGSLSFDGSDKYVNVGSLGSQFTNFTVEIWFKSDSVTNYRNPIDCNFLIENGSYSNLGPRLEQNSSGNLCWLVGSGSNVYTSIDVVPSGLDVSKYHYAAITKSSSTLFTTYYNGNAVTTTNFSNWTGSMLNVNIGRGFSVDSERRFNGKIPSVKIYNRALSAAEVSQNYNALRGRFSI
jgi:hypothetical protein